MYYIPQLTSSDCGFACLKMLLANYHDDENYLFLEENEDFGEYSLADLVKIGEKYDTKLLGFKMEDKEEIFKNTVFPFMAVFVGENNEKHAVVVTSFKFGFVNTLDPTFGERTLTKRSFLALWGGHGIFLDEKNIKKKCPKKVEDPISKKDYWINGILQLLSYAFIALALFFLDDVNRIWLPVLFLCLFVLFEIIMRSNSVRLMRKIDDYYVGELTYIPHNKSTYFYRLQEYKKVALLGPINFIFKLMVCVFLIVLTLLNGDANVYLLICPALLAVVDAFVVSPKLKQKEFEISCKESEMIKHDELYDFKTKCDEIHSMSYEYGKTNLIKKYGFLLVMTLCSFLVMLLNKEILLPYCAFFILVENIFYESLFALLTYQDKNNEYLKVKALFHNSLK